MSKAVLSDKYPEYADKLTKLGYTAIPSERVESFIEYERDHADMQCLIIDDTAFVLSVCDKLANALKSSYNVVLCGDNISGRYPYNVALNAAVAGKYVICKADSLDGDVTEYCRKHGYKLINVRQGYAKCSCAVVSDKALITADMSIYRALDDTDIDVLRIGQGSVTLDGAEYGFIGGASGYDKAKKTLYFCGNVDTHPDGEDIRAFCKKHGTEIVCLSDGELTDIGGIIFC